MQGSLPRRLALLAFVVALAGAAPASATAGPPRDLPARAWILVDADDGQVLAAHQAKSSRAIASTTKLMTAYVARRDLKLGQSVVAPSYDALPSESLLGLETGESIKVRDLLYGLLIVSGNDAAVTLARAAAGSGAGFVTEMNDAADQLGLDDTSYSNPVGLDQQGNHSSAEDLADLAIQMRKDSLFRRIFDTSETVIESGDHPRDLVNRNTLVQTVPYVNGVKTGYTIDAGNVLVASGKQKGVELVSAVLGAPTESERDSASLSLLDYGFSLYHRRTPVKRDEVTARVAIHDRDASVALTPSREVGITARHGQLVATTVDAPGELDGPVSEGERLGEVVVTIDGEVAGRAALVAASSEDSAGVVERFDAAVPGPRAVAWALAIAVAALALLAVRALWMRR